MKTRCSYMLENSRGFNYTPGKRVPRTKKQRGKGRAGVARESTAGRRSGMGHSVQCARRITFCTGHRVLRHEGKCAHLHGHNYTAIVHAAAPDLDGLGRVVDFAE